MNRKGWLILFSIIFIFVALPVTIFLVMHQGDLRSRASAPDQLEAEGGVLGGPAQTKSDSLASGGQYVAFGTNPSPTPQPTGTQVSCSNYVSLTGNDSNSGTSTTSPWLTIQKAANTVPAGATVCIRTGTYDGFSMNRSGTQTAPIIFTSYPGERAVVDGKSTRSETIHIGGVSDIKITNLTVQGALAPRAPGYYQSGGGIIVTGSSNRITITNNLIKENVAYGIETYNSTNVLIDGNEVTGNATGVSIQQSSNGVVLSNNTIHDQNKMMINTPGGNDDVGAGGVAFVKTSGTVIAKGNTIYRNRADSYDYVHDGSAFETYGASGVQILNNVMWDNEVNFESGTDANATDPNIKGCTNDVFAGNVAYNPNPNSRNAGVLLRCAVNMVIANNTFVNMSQWTFDIGTSSTTYSGLITGIKIQNNIVVMDEGKMIGIQSNVTDAVKSTLTINNNLLYNPGFNIGDFRGPLYRDLPSWRAATGFDINSINADPQFIDAANHDYRLKPASPAIGKSMPIPGINSNNNLGAY